MNLQYIRQYISNVTDYDALANAEYAGQLDTIINEIYRQIFSEKPFTFAQKEVKVDVKADVTVTASGSYSAPNKLTIITATVAVPTWIEGNIVEIDGIEYKVLYCDRGLNTRFYIKEVVPTFASLSIVFKQRFIRLPQDCVSILQVSRRSFTISPTDVGRFVPLTRFEDEYYNLPLDEVNIPNYWLPQDADYVRAPSVAPLVSATGTVAGQGTRLVQVAMTYVQYDLSGEPSEIESGLSPFSDVIELGDAEQLRVTLPALSANGLSRRIYIANAADPRQFDGYYRVGVLYAPTTGGTQDIDFTETSFDNGTFTLDTTAYQYSDGYRQRIRLYPRQSEDFQASVRYLYRPAPLFEDADTLELPSSHALIVAYGALFDVLNKHDNTQLALIYKQKFDMEMIKLEQRFLTQTPRRFVKGFMSNSGVDTVPMFSPLKRLP